MHSVYCLQSFGSHLPACLAQLTLEQYGRHDLADSLPTNGQGCGAGYVVPPNYDSLLGKLIVWGEDRAQAIARMTRCIDEVTITGARYLRGVC